MHGGTLALTRRGALAAGTALLLTPGAALAADAAASGAIDHVMIGVPDLAAASAALAQATGVNPAIGGRHASGGTWNALASLGPRRYLELIAPDPQAPATEQGEFWKLLKAMPGPRMLGLALTPPGGIAATTGRARAAGLDAKAEAGSRVTPDGRTLRWQTMGIDSGTEAVSLYFVDWGTTPQPGSTTPPGLALVKLGLSLMGAEKVRGRLRTLGIELDIAEGPPVFTATVEGPKGRWAA